MVSKTPGRQYSIYWPSILSAYFVPNCRSVHHVRRAPTKQQRHNEPQHANHSRYYAKNVHSCAESGHLRSNQSPVYAPINHGNTLRLTVAPFWYVNVSNRKTRNLGHLTENVYWSDNPSTAVAHQRVPTMPNKHPLDRGSATCLDQPTTPCMMQRICVFIRTRTM